MSNTIPNLINGLGVPSHTGMWFDKISPHSGKGIYKAARSNHVDVADAVQAAKKAFQPWSEMPAVKRGMILHNIVVEMEKEKENIAKVVATETGKSPKDAMAETNGAIALGLFYASEGQRLYGRTTTSGVENKHAMTVRRPIGVAGLIVPANTPIANVAWKVFPALICGNASILKAAEDAPGTAWIFGQIAHRVGLPEGVLNIIQGFGNEAGVPLVEHPGVDVISFTGSTQVGRSIQRAAAQNITKVSLELGGKNPFVVCDDADLEIAAKWVLLSAFSNAGQRCSSGSRIIVFESIYNEFKKILLDSIGKLKVGPTDADDFGPVLNLRYLEALLKAIREAKNRGAVLLTGGTRLQDTYHKNGFYLSPTLFENVSTQDDLSVKELFGPISVLYKVSDFQEALDLANNSTYGLTAAIHTSNLHRAMEFCNRIRSGVAVVNGGTFGSEPHMPFGGLGHSGNGWREPGTEALDVYSELKDIYINVFPKQI